MFKKLIVKHLCRIGLFFVWEYTIIIKNWKGDTNPFSDFKKAYVLKFKWWVFNMSKNRKPISRIYCFIENFLLFLSYNLEGIRKRKKKGKN